MNTSTILLGLLTAAILVHFRGAYLLAQRQRAVITRLHAYLLYWQMCVIDNNIFNFFYLGMEWNKEIRDLVAKGEGAEALAKLRVQKKDDIDALRVKLENEAHDLDIEELKTQLKQLPEDAVTHILRSSERFEQNLLDGKTWVTDDDASTLGPYYAHVCVRMKMNMITAASKVVSQVILFISAPEKYSVKVNAKEIANVIWHGVLVSKDIDELFDYVKMAREKSLIRVTWSNMWL